MFDRREGEADRDHEGEEARDVGLDPRDADEQEDRGERREGVERGVHRDREQVVGAGARAPYAEARPGVAVAEHPGRAPVEEHARDAADEDQHDPRREPPREERADPVEERLEEAEAEADRRAERRTVGEEGQPAAVRDDPGALEGLLDERRDDEDQEEDAERRVPVQEDELGSRVALADRGPEPDDDRLEEPGREGGKERAVGERAQDRPPPFRPVPLRPADPRDVDERRNERRQDEGRQVERFPRDAQVPPPGRGYR